MVVVGLISRSSEGAFSGGSLEIKGNLNSQQAGIWVNGEGKVTAVTVSTGGFWGSVADRVLCSACGTVLMVRAAGCVPGI
jgi:hypothetical protein